MPETTLEWSQPAPTLLGITQPFKSLGTVTVGLANIDLIQDVQVVEWCWEEVEECEKAGSNIYMGYDCKYHPSK